MNLLDCLVNCNSKFDFIGAQVDDYYWVVVISLDDCIERVSAKSDFLCCL